MSHWFLIAGVTVTVEWKVSTTNSIATLGALAWVSGAAYGTERVTTAEPLSDTTQSFSVTGLTRAQLANGVFEVRVRASRGTSNTAFTASLDAVSVRVDYTAQVPTAITVTATGATTTRGADSFTYDQANRLRTATVSGITETYTYDGDGVRFSRQVGAGPVARYVSDVNTSLPVTLDDGTRKYVWGQGLAYAVSGTALEVYHTDRLGSVRAITDAAGAVTATYRTDEFGVSTATTGTSSQPFAFTGEPRDATGLSYLRARYYDPSLGRFISRDPLVGSSSSPQSLNRYVYAANNPQTYVDPSGRCFMVVPGAAAAGAGVGSVVPVAGTAAGAAAVGFIAFLGCVIIVASSLIDTKEGGVVPQRQDNWEKQIHRWEPPAPVWEPGKGPIGPRGPGRHIWWKIIAGTLVVARVGKSLVLRPR